MTPLSPLRSPVSFAFAVVCAFAATSQAGPPDFIFPPGSGVVNVLDFGAVPNDGKDDTAAIQKALDNTPAGHKVIYLPDGVYDVTGTLSWPMGVNDGQRWKYTTLQGQSRAGTILQIPDNTPFFGDAGAPKPVIFTGGGPAQRFGNEVRDLTVNTGKGNPGAIGIQFNASNYGCLRNVDILSGDGKGVAGLDMSFVGEVGPLLVKDLYVKGFDYGVKTQENEASQTLENITLEDQNVCAVYNRHQSVFYRNLKTKGAVTAVNNDQHSGFISLIDARLEGVGPVAATLPAMLQSKQTTAFLRNVQTPGFALAVKNQTGADVTELVVPEWSSTGVKNLFETDGKKSLNLPVKPTPVVPLDPDFKNWADVTTYGAKAGDGKDDTVAIQKAIDSGKTTVFFPAAGTARDSFFELQGTLHVRGKVERLIGFSGVVSGDGKVRVEDGAAPVVVIERIGFGFFDKMTMEIVTRRTVVLKDCSVDKGFIHTGTGEFFIENVVAGGQCVFRGGPAWARQLNPEVDGVHVLVDGARVWIHGMKIEVKGTVLEARNNAAVEITGLFVYTSHMPDKSPMFIVNNSRFSVSFREKTNFAQSYPVIVRETRSGSTRQWTNRQGGGSQAGLFTAGTPK